MPAKVAIAANTLRFPAVRLAGSEEDFAAGLIYVPHIVAAFDQVHVTHVLLSNGARIEIDMPFKKFCTRQNIDNTAT